MKNKKKIILTITGVGIAVVLSVLFFKKDRMTVDARIEQDMKIMTSYSSETLASSNPYHYIDNEAYEDIVSMGMDAVYSLTSNYSDVGGLQGYIAAIAVTDITGVDFDTVSEESFDTSDEFWDDWNSFIADMPDDFEKIINGSTDIENDISDYGIFGEVFVDKINNDKDGEIEIAGQTIDYEINDIDIPEIKEKDHKELKKAERYIEGISDKANNIQN